MERVDGEKLEGLPHSLFFPAPTTTQVAIVVGGGNYYRGAADVVSAHGVDRATGDYVGA
jgi:uridylate kinase